VSVTKRPAETRGDSRLGRGLSALIPASRIPAEDPGRSAPREYFKIAIEEIHPTPDQPRQLFEEDALEQLVVSIRQHGLQQPLVVRQRPAADGGGFFIIAGERRWRAAQRAGLRELPVLVREATPALAFELALVENLQRRDLNPMEEAESFRRLIEEHKQTHEQLAEKIGRDRTTITNTMRLLELPPPVRRLVAERRLSAGQARPLLALRESPVQLEALARRVIEGGLSARQVEAAVKDAKQKAAGVAKPVPKKSAAVADLEGRLQKSLGTRVIVHDQGGGKGTLEVHYHSLDELDRLIAVFTR
jgi:ParB family chromosome partitioning protein